MIFSIKNARPTTTGSNRYWIAPTASVIGAVELGEDVSIWFGAVVRGDNEPITIGDRSNVQDGCILHTDMGHPLVIGSDVTLGHGAIVHGCTIEDGALVGMGAIVLNDAVVGRNAVVGAGALVTERQIVPENAVVIGMPAKVVGAVDTERTKRIRAGVLRYVEKWQHYLAELTEVPDQRVLAPTPGLMTTMENPGDKDLRRAQLAQEELDAME
jgi:carbonic anhydrase/acetyltransferase-like protein (isoleucine patch superfamily)